MLTLVTSHTTMENKKVAKVVILCSLMLVLILELSFQDIFQGSFHSLKLMKTVPGNPFCNCNKDRIANIMEHAIANDTGNDTEVLLETLSYLILSIDNYLPVLSNTTGRISDIMDLEAQKVKLKELRNGLISHIVNATNETTKGDRKVEKEVADTQGNFKVNDTNKIHMKNMSKSSLKQEQKKKENNIEKEGFDIDLSKVLTIVLNCNGYTNKDLANVDRMLRDVIVTYPGVHVIIFSPHKLNSSIKNVTYSHRGKGSGDIWAKLIGQVTTSHVLVLRDAVAMDKESRIHSLMYKLNKMNLDLIGGATKDVNSGHWNMGCYQMALRNDVLVYKSGYKSSKNACVFCHHIDGPFIAKTTLFKQHKFKGSDIPQELVFHDFFFDQFRRNSSKRFAVCPDSMFLTRTVLNVNVTEMSRSSWLRFGVSNNVHRIVLSNGQAHTFTCTELGVTGSSRDDGKSAPYCTIQELVDHIKFVMKTCRDNKIVCELTWGTEFGAVKFNGVPPWELDGDLSFYTPQAKKLLALKPLFVKRGYSLYLWRYTGEYDSPWLRTSGKWWRLDLFNRTHMDSVDLIAQGKPPTKVLFDGEWVETSGNLGLTVRHVYGTPGGGGSDGSERPEGSEIYQHKDHDSTYHPSDPKIHYESCPKGPNHNCLDRMPLDGNMDMGDPVP